MARSTLVFALAALMVSCASAPKAGPIRIAIYGVTSLGPEGTPLAATASELIEDRLSRSGRFEIMKSNRLAMHPRESALEYARDLGADWVVSGTITKFGMQGRVGEVLLNVEVQKVGTGEVLHAGHRRGTAEGRPAAKSESILNRAVQDAAQALVQQVVELAP